MPATAASAHEICTAMAHECGNAGLRCCCGDRSDSNPAPTASDRTHAVPDSLQAFVCAGAIGLMPVTVLAAPHLAAAIGSPPPDLPILFSDLRI